MSSDFISRYQAEFNFIPLNLLPINLYLNNIVNFHLLQPNQREKFSPLKVSN